MAGPFCEGCLQTWKVQNGMPGRAADWDARSLQVFISLGSLPVLQAVWTQKKFSYFQQFYLKAHFNWYASSPNFTNSTNIKELIIFNLRFRIIWCKYLALSNFLSSRLFSVAGTDLQGLATVQPLNPRSQAFKIYDRELGFTFNSNVDAVSGIRSKLRNWNLHSRFWWYRPGNK
jgi:hypothetical protein